jgi:alpha-beta hydrolase superfamily lysophospholipase
MSEIVEYLKMTDGFNLFCRHWKAVHSLKRVIICIHGMGCHSGVFKPLAEDLTSKGVEVYGLDLRGFGNSKEAVFPRGDTRDFSRHLQDLDDAVKLIQSKSSQQKIFMLGHSLGGCYTLWYAAKYPDSLDGIVVAAPAIDVKSRVPLKERAQFPFLLLNAPETMIDTDKALEDQNRGEFTSTPIQDSLFTRRFSVRWLSGIGSTLMRDKLFQNASQIKMPTLIVQGEADTEALPDGANRLLEALKAQDKTLKTFPDADHGLYNAISRLTTSEKAPEKKARLISTIADWLKTR